ncbi:hydrogenase maturation protease, partial [bacterium]|nr:hydrogenase maturation protease [bacterium]
MNGVLVASLGNPLVGDDGVGLAVLKQLEQQELPVEVKLVDLGTDLLALSSHLDGIGKVILLDAVNFGGEPGELRRFD